MVERNIRCRELIASYIFGHAILVDFQVIVSGPRIGVPETIRAVNKAVEAWKLRPNSMSLGLLAWPYCVTASLAVGRQRDFFLRMVAEARPEGMLTLMGYALPDLVSTVENSWNEFDERKVRGQEQCYDWREDLRVRAW